MEWIVYVLFLHIHFIEKQYKIKVFQRGIIETPKDEICFTIYLNWIFLAIRSCWGESAKSHPTFSPGSVS